MSSNDRYKEWEKDFREFLDAEAIRPPAELSRKILDHVSSKLNPSPWLVFSKLLAFVVITGSITLFFCPQFGLGASDGPGLMYFFMKYGRNVCQFGCGAFFIGSGILASAFLLRPEELNVLSRNKFLQISAVSGLSLGVFMMFDASIFFTLAVLWLIGALMGGLLFFEVGFWLRRKFLVYAY